jgi:hypothetical protein
LQFRHLVAAKSFSDALNGQPASEGEVVADQPPRDLLEPATE